MIKLDLTKEEIDDLINQKGMALGLCVKFEADYIIKKEGEGSIEKIEKNVEELGYPIEFKHVSSFRWYPLGLSCFLLLVLMGTFKWNEKDIFDMAYEIPMNFILSKLLIQTLTIEKIFRNFQKYWRKYADVGTWEIINYNSEEKYANLRLSDFPKYHPILYYYFMGVLKKVIELVTKSKNVEIIQAKNIFKGDIDDEFKITW